MDCTDRATSPEAPTSPKRAFVLFSQADGVISEHDKAADARVAYLLYSRKHGALAAELTSVYHRSEAGWTRF